jgi:hypothetical protein
LTFPTTSILDSGIRDDEGPPPSSDWSSSVDSDDAGMKIVSNQVAPDWTGRSSALWDDLFTRSQEVYATVEALPPDVSGCMELWLSVQDGGTSAPSGYCLRFWHNPGAGVGVLEIDRMDAGSFTRLFDVPQTIIVGDQFGGSNDNGTVGIFVSGVFQTSSFDTTYEDGKIGIGTLNDGALSTRYSNFGGGGKPSVSPSFAEIAETSNRADSGGEKG